MSLPRSTQSTPIRVTLVSFSMYSLLSLRGLLVLHFQKSFLFFVFVDKETGTHNTHIFSPHELFLLPDAIKMRYFFVFVR